MAQKAKNVANKTYTLSIQNGADKTMIHHGTYQVLGGNSASLTATNPQIAQNQANSL